MLNGKYVMQTDVLSRVNEDGSIILMKKYNNKVFFKLDGLAAIIWKDISSGASLQEVMKNIVTEYDITEEQVQKDINSLLQALLRKDLIRESVLNNEDPVEFVRQWPKSLGLLQQRILAWFSREGIRTDNVWFTDIEMVFPDRLKNESEIQVVFFGAFFERFFESGNWPQKKYTFWTLSGRVRNVLTEMFFLPLRTVRQIPRYEIIPRASFENQPDLTKDLKLLYAGRISAQKNIEFFLAFAHELQERLSVNVETILLGEWDNNVPKGRGRTTMTPFQKTIDAFTKNLGSFKEVPKFIPDLGVDEWTSYLDGNVLLASFSTFICEDFGYSLAQAQERGVALVLSDWGGHSDIQGTNVSLIKREDIAEDLLPFDEITTKGREAAARFIRKELLSPRESKPDRFESEFLTLNELHDLRLKVLSKFGFELAMLGQDRANLIANACKGREYFETYDKLFSGN